MCPKEIVYQECQRKTDMNISSDLDSLAITDGTLNRIIDKVKHMLYLSNSD